MYAEIIPLIQALSSRTSTAKSHNQTIELHFHWWISTQICTIPFWVNLYLWPHSSKEFHNLSIMHIKMFALVGLTCSLYFWYPYHLWIYKFKLYISSTTFSTLKNSSLINFLWLFCNAPPFLTPPFFVHFHIFIFEMRDQSMENTQPKGTMVIVLYCVNLFWFVPCFSPNKPQQSGFYFHHPQCLSSLTGCPRGKKNHTCNKQHFWGVFWREHAPTRSSVGSPAADTTRKPVHPTVGKAHRGSGGYRKEEPIFLFQIKMHCSKCPCISF